jgi:hypothetical protein
MVVEGFTELRPLIDQLLGWCVLVAPLRCVLASSFPFRAWLCLSCARPLREPPGATACAARVRRLTEQFEDAAAAAAGHAWKVPISGLVSTYLAGARATPAPCQPAESRLCRLAYSAARRRLARPVLA